MLEAFTALVAVDRSFPGVDHSVALEGTLEMECLVTYSTAESLDAQMKVLVSLQLSHRHKGLVTVSTRMLHPRVSQHVLLQRLLVQK